MLFDFDGIEDYIAERKVFFGKLPFDIEWDWNNLIEMVDTHPESLYDRNTKKFRIGLNNFHQRDSAPQFAKDVLKEMLEVFSLHADKRSITNIAFCGFGRDSDSYPWHADKMDVFLIQVLNSVELRVETTEWEDEPRWFNPGDYVWIPRGTHHQIIPHDSRVTFSFGVEGEPDPSLYF